MKLIFWAYSIGIYLLSVWKLSDMPPAPGGDKAHHFVAFAVFAFLLMCAYKHLKLWKVLIISVLFGYLIEISQYFLPYRCYELLDLTADTGGAVLGILAGMVILKRNTF